MRKLVGAALATALVLTGAVAAWGAATGNETLISVNFTTGNKKDSGPNSGVIRHEQMPSDPADGQAATTSRIRLIFGRGMILNSGIWPRRARCNIRTVNQRGSDSGCPGRARVGGGSVNLLAGGGGQIPEAADLRLWVSTDGDLFLFLDSRPGQPVELNAAIPCEVTRRRSALCSIPQVLQRPAGVPSSIKDLTLRIRAVISIRGTRRGILQNTGCRRFYVLTIETHFDDGVRKRDSDRVRC
jgi:hypothetical protein